MTRPSIHRSRRRRVPIALGALALLLLGTSAASGVSTRTLAYRYNTLWSTAVRLLRVDRGYDIRDKDKDNGYILFVYPDERGAVKQCPATLEIIHIGESKNDLRHRLKLKIAHQPTYIEVHLLDRFEQKLQEEQGDPPKPKEKPSPPRDKRPKKKPNQP